VWLRQTLFEISRRRAKRLVRSGRKQLEIAYGRDHGTDPALPVRPLAICRTPDWTEAAESEGFDPPGASSAGSKLNGEYVADASVFSMSKVC
jgi:hypothetical protein